MKIVATLGLLCAAVFFLRYALARPSSNFAAACGVCVALAAWAFPVSLVAAGMLAAPLLDRRWPVRARVHLVGSGFLGLGLFLLPWVLSRGR